MGSGGRRDLLHRDDGAEHERRTEGAPQTVRVDPTPTRWMPMLGLGVLIAFVAGVTVADLLETAPPAPPDTPAVEEGR